MNAIIELLTKADIKVNGNRPSDIIVHNEQLYNRVLAQGSLGLGESYMDGWWDCKELDEFFHKVIAAELDKKVIPKTIVFHHAKAVLLNMQTKSRSQKVAQEHYDLGNTFYEHMLDKNMQYTCGYWKRAKNLEDAQVAKMDLVCKKMGLKKGMKVLELGWGGFARYAAKKYGVIISAYNISKEQVAYAEKQPNNLPITYHLQDYREATGTFDRVISIGMCEHVGPKNYAAFFSLITDRLRKDGLALVHTIGSLKSKYSSDQWIEKYIFPNSVLPSLALLTKAAEEKLVIEDIHNFGADYDKTLVAWHANFEKNWPKFKEQYGERFYRMWRYYLLACAGGFRSRKLQLWQIVLSKEGMKGGYKCIR